MSKRRVSRKPKDFPSIDINMGEYKTPVLKSPIDVVPHSVPMPGFLLFSNFVCVVLILVSLGYATKSQLDGSYVGLYESLSIVLFGFFIPVVNLYLVSRSNPLSKWTLLFNAFGVSVFGLVVIYEENSGLQLMLGLMLLFVFLIISFYFLLIRKKTKYYYHAIKTGEVLDSSLLKHVLSNNLINFINKHIYFVGEIFVILLAFWVIAYVVLM